MSLEKNVLVDIPKVFHSHATNAPFSKCMNCDCLLLNTEYVIEKAIRRYKEFSSTDTIFEYAICMKCHEEFVSAYSVSSLNNIQNYFLENANFDHKRTDLHEKLKEGHFNINEWISSCIIKGTHVDDLTEYQIGCQCIGNKMVVLNMPFMIGHEAMDEISQLLSEKTRGEMDRFIDDFFGLPPELKKLLKDSGVLVM
jgi:hypothetical protein